MSQIIVNKEIKLIIAIVRPHLEYCIQAWRLYRKKDIDMLDEYKGEQPKILNGYEDTDRNMFFLDKEERRTR